MSAQTLTLKSIMDPTGSHQVGVQLAFFTAGVPFAKLEIPATIGGSISMETAAMIYTFLGKLLPPDLR
jgi:hypothetical protein